MYDLADLTEKDWAAQVVTLARQLGWRRYHTYRSDRSQPGFPDEVLLRERVIYLELKRETGKLSDAQKDWIGALLAAGAEAYVARPRDLEPLAEILACRGDPFAKTATAETAALLRQRTAQQVS